MRRIFFAILLALAVAPAARAQDAGTLAADFLAEKGSDYAACFQLPGLQGLESDLTAPDQATQKVLRRVMLAVDSSGSMAGQVGGQSKMQAARIAARDFLAALPEDVEAGLIAFGHKGNNRSEGRVQSCAGVEVLAQLGRDRSAQIQAIEQLTATGWTPLAAAITRAGQAFSARDTPGEQVVYVVSDGKETCDGDPAEAARALVQSEVRAVVNIIGFDLAEADRAELMAVAEAGGGRFEEVATDNLSQNLGQRLADLARGGEMLAIQAQGGRLVVANSAETARVAIAMRACISTAMIAENRALTFAGLRIKDKATWREAQDLIRNRQARMERIGAVFAKAGSINRNAVNAAISHDIEGTRVQFEAAMAD